MKRSNEQQELNNQQPEQQPSGQEIAPINKRPRYHQPNYGDLLPQRYNNNMYHQYNNGGYPSFNQQQHAQHGYGSIYNMAYTTPATGAVNGQQQQYAYPTANAGAGMYNTAMTPMAQQQQQQQQIAAANNLFNGAEASRTIYLGNITKEIPPHEVLKCVRTGLLESYRLCPEKSCAFLSFFDPRSAQAFFAEYLTKKLIVKETEIKIGWGKANILNNQLKLQVQGGATRNVYLGRLTTDHTEESIKANLVKFGPIEHIRLLREKNIAFVHFLNIACAIKCVNTLITDPEWKDQRINYGKDHCTGSQQGLQTAAVAGTHQFEFNGFNPYILHQQPYYQQQVEQSLVAPSHNTARTLYIGNIHPDAKTEDICNAIRGGNLLQIRFFPEKHIAFVTFFDAQTCLKVHTYAQEHGIVVKGRKLRVGYGKSSSISLPVANAVQQGATRNIYIGGIPDTLTEEQLRADFSQYGEIELVNTFREKKCAFVNFTAVANAVTAITSMKLKPDYADYKLNFGKDRCGNPFKPVVTKKEKKALEAAATLEANQAGNATTGGAAGVGAAAPAPATPATGAAVDEAAAPNATPGAVAGGESAAGVEGVAAPAAVKIEADAAIAEKKEVEVKTEEK